MFARPLWRYLFRAVGLPTFDESLLRRWSACDALQQSPVTYLFGRVLDTGDALQLPTSAIQKGTKVLKTAKLGGPSADHLVAVVAQASWPSRGQPRHVQDGLVDASRTQVEAGDSRGRTQSLKNVMQNQNIVRSKVVWAFASNDGVELIANPVRDLPQPGTGDVVRRRRGREHDGDGQAVTSGYHM
jgi:hypothetical protein